MEELDLADFRHGGVNITGFRLLSPNGNRFQAVQKDWSNLSSEFWKGAGPGSNLTVGYVSDHVVLS